MGHHLGSLAAWTNLIKPSRLTSETRGALAIDSEGTWGAIFLVTPFSNDAVDFEIQAMHYIIGEQRWIEEGSAGSTLGGLHFPWIPPPLGWEDRYLFTTTVLGKAVVGEGDVDDDYEFLAVAGFASQTVEWIDIRHDGIQRYISVAAPLRAFIAVGVGTTGLVKLTPCDATRDPIGPASLFPSGT